MDVHRLLTAAVASAAAALAAAGPAVAAADQPAVDQPAADLAPPNRVIVVFERGTSVAERADARADAETAAIKTLGRTDFQLVAPQPGQTVAEAVAALNADPNVRVAERDGYSRIQSVPNDPRFGDLWGLRNTGQNVNGVTGGVAGADISAPLAWDRTVGTPPTVVADLDSGYRFQHPDLAPVAWSNPGETGGGKESNGVDDDGNGKIDDWRGWDAISSDNDPTDAVNGHGVHTAGTIGAKGDNGVGVTGVAQNVRIMPVRVCNDAGSCPFSAQVEGINYAGRNGARAANMSLGGSGGSNAVLNALAAWPQTLFVISAGNDNRNNDGTTKTFPCVLDPSQTNTGGLTYTPPAGAIDNVVCVQATTQADTKASFSSYGATTVDLGAPGTETLSTYIDAEYLSETFEADAGFDGWTSTAAGGNFLRTQTGALAGSWSLTNDTATQADGSTRNTLTPAAAVPDDTASCTLSYRRNLTLAAGTSDGFTYGLVIDGVAGAPVSGTTTGVVSVQRVFTIPPGQHEVGAVFTYSRGAGQAATNGVLIDDVRLTCRVPSGAETGSTLEFLQGTSMAAPHVTGTAALMFSLKPAATVTDVRSALLAGVDPVPALAGTTATGGRLNAWKALAALVPLDTAITSGPSGTTTSTTASFAFDSNGSGPAGFECRLDGGAYSACTSPAAYPDLDEGPHTFDVRAKLPGGVDATPATRAWTVAIGPPDELGGGMTPGAGPMDVATGPDGNLWFTQWDGHRIGRITRSGAITEFSAGITGAARPSEIVAGPDGNLWFTEYDGSRVGRITPDGQVTEFELPDANAEPDGIVAGPDGSLWFTMHGANAIGRITTAGAITTFSDGISPSAGLGEIAAGPDGNLWFTEFDGNRIGRITPAGTVTEFPLPTPGSKPYGIAPGPDGALWFTEWEGNRIGRITTGASPSIQEFPLARAGARPWGIAAGPDGALWFVETAKNRIGRITTAGQVTERYIATPGSEPQLIAAGPDGNMWFSMQSADRIGRMATGQPAARPAISGTPQPGQALSCPPGTWSSALLATTRQWLRDGTPIPGATGTTFTPAGGDVGRAIACRVSATFTALPMPVTVDSDAVTIGAAPPVGPAGTPPAPPAGPASTPPAPPAGPASTPPAPPPAPAITGLAVTPARFAVDARGAAERPAVAAAPKGTTFRFRSATAARVLYTVEALRPGKRSGRRCVAPTRANRAKRSCTRVVLAGRFAAAAVPGNNRKKFSGRIGARRLAPGAYRATLVAISGARRSAPRSAAFTVVAR